MDNSTPEEMIIDYLDGSLSDQEQKAFEEKLSTDPALSAQLARFEQAREGLRIRGIRNEVMAARAEMLSQETATPVRSIGSRRIIRVILAAAAAILFAVIGFQLYEYTNPSLSDLYNQKYQPYELRVTRSGTDTSNQLITDAFAQQKYYEVIALESSARVPQEFLLLGIAYMQTRQSEKAEKYFSTVQQDPTASREIREEADYYSIMNDIANGRKEKAVAAIERINQSADHAYKGFFDQDFIKELKKAK